MKSKKEYVLLGIICILISGLGFGFMQVFVKLSGDLPSVQKTFFRNLIASLVSLIPVLKNKIDIKQMKGNWCLLILRSMFGTVGIVLNFYAVEKLTISDASMLQKLSPFVVIFLSALFLKEKIKLYQYICVTIAFIGTLFVIKPDISGQFISIGAIAALLGAIAAGSAYTCLRSLSLRGVKREFIIFFFAVFSCIAILPWVIVNYQPMSTNQIIYLILVGISATVGQFGITFAYSFAPAKKIAVFEYSQIVFAAVLGYVILGQITDYYSWIGYLIIIGVGIYMMIKGAKDKND